MQDFICKYWNVVNVPDISSYIPLINLVCAFKLKIGYLMSQKANFYSLQSISVFLNKLLIYIVILYTETTTTTYSHSYISQSVQCEYYL